MTLDRANSAGTGRLHASRLGAPTGGMFTWLSLPAGLDVRELRSAATEARVAYVPGRAFYVGDEGDNERRLSYSSLTEADLDEAGRRLAGVIASALAFT